MAKSSDTVFSGFHALSEPIRIQVIELLLQSLKDEIVHDEPVRKPFHIRTFNLGKDIHLDRDEMYADRVV